VVDIGEKEENGEIWSVRVKPTLDRLLDGFIELDTHSNKSEFIRQAVREKLERHGVSIGLERKENKKKK
jgi:Arc/MetJ-type ribon-helix-helix transcriptional regulator